MKATVTTKVCSCFLLPRSMVAMLLLLCVGAAPTAHSQGTLTFDGQKLTDNYYEQGFWFRVVPGIPYDPPPHMNGADVLGFSTSLSGYYVSLSLTGGGTFGLSSVNLSGAFYNGTTLQFDGYFEDGPMVSTTFSVPYNFQWSTYQFGSEFSSGLVRVDIPNNPWAMDNLAYMNIVPEPGALSLFSLGVFALVARRFARARSECIGPLSS
jgi:hypothetical protein